jgi:hypothetical protein
LMSFPSSDVTSTGLDHGQRSGFVILIDPSEAYDQIEPYNKFCFDIIHIHCNKQLFFILTVSQ